MRWKKERNDGRKKGMKWKKGNRKLEGGEGGRNGERDEDGESEVRKRRKEREKFSSQRDENESDYEKRDFLASSCKERVRERERE